MRLRQFLSYEHRALCRIDPIDCLCLVWKWLKRVGSPMPEGRIYRIPTAGNQR